MARKEIVFFGNHLLGKHMDENTARTLLKLHDITEGQGGIKELRNIINVLTNSQVDKMIRLNTELEKDHIKTGYRSVGEVDFTKASELFEPEDIEIGSLSDLQTVGVMYMYLAKRMVLGDSVGMGKTVQVAALCKYLSEKAEEEGRDFHILYLTEKNLIEQSSRELIKFSGRYFRKLTGTKKDIEDFVYHNEEGYDCQNICGSHSLVKHPAFHKYIEQFKQINGFFPFDVIIIDESGSLLTNPSTTNYKLAKTLADQAEYVIEMNAGSFENALDKFYAQLAFVDDTFLYTKTEFSNRYKVTEWFGGRPQFRGKYKNADDFREKVKLRYLKRTRKSQGAKMVNCSANLIEVKPSKIQKEFLRKSSMPNMVYDCPTNLDNSVIFNEENVPKAGALVELLTGKLKNVDQVLVYTTLKEPHRHLKRLLESRGISTEAMNGDTPLATRNQIISGFKNGAFKVLITNVQRGLNFGACNHCVFYNYDGNPNNMTQFEGRITRDFDIINKHAYVIVTEGKEKDRLMKEITTRAKASHDFSGSDFSMVLDLLIGNDR